MPEILQEIGAAAGLAAVVGLAVLSALYFSQARDVKRLREWAGRAPERSEQVGTAAVPGRVVAQPQPPRAPVPPPGPPPVPGKAPAVPGAAGRPAAATPAGQAAPAVAASATGAGPATAQQDKPTGAQAPAGENSNAAAAAASGAAAGAVAAGAGQAGAEGSAKEGGGAKPDATKDAPGAGQPDVTKDAPGAGKPDVANQAAGAAAPDAAKPDTPGGKPADGQAAEQPNGSAGQRPTASAATATPGTASPSPAGPTAPQVPRPGAPTAPPRQAAAATPAAGRPGAGPSVPAGGSRFAGRPGGAARPSPQETAIIPPRRSGGGLSARYLAIGLAGLVVLGGAAAYGITQLTGDDDSPGTSQGTPSGEVAGDGSAAAKPKQGGAVKPGSVTVAVLNGTTVPGLAATLSDEVGAAGFKVGTITNFSDQQLAESVVQYAPGHEAEGRAVSRRLGITQREPVNPSSEALAGDATVIVIAGADKAP